MIVGYARVSTKDQNLDRQIETLTAAGVEKLFVEKQSGQNIEGRPVFQEMLEFLREKDVLVVAELDRLGRNMQDIANTLHLLKQKGIIFKAMNLPHIDTNDPTLNELFSSLTISIYSYVAESERKKIKERQKQGVAIAKKKGNYKGRQKKYSLDSLDKQGRLVAESVVKDFNNNDSQKEISVKYNISRNTVLNILREAGLK